MNMPGIGKRMPYKVPDGVFDDIERNVLSATGCARKPSHRLRAVSIAVAVVASLVLIVQLKVSQKPRALRQAQHPGLWFQLVAEPIEATREAQGDRRDIQRKVI